MSKGFKSALIGGASLVALSTGAFAAEFNIPGGDLAAALNEFTAQTNVALIVSGDAIRGVHTRGARGTLSADDALSHILADTGFVMQRRSSGAITIVQKPRVVAAPPTYTEQADAGQERLAAAGVETVVVTSSKIKGDIQTVPIAITALSQEQLTSRQIAGGPDLVKEVPNLTFSKTNFTGYNIQIRGIGTQAISVTTDPAVAVAFNDTPFIRNHFFEQEFYDVSQVEVLRGPQGTLYGRNATAGVVNVISAKPTDQFEAMLSADWGNYLNRRYEGMVNIPIVDDRLDLRVAGEWTKRDGYTFNETTGKPIDGRDLWSGRVTLGWKPVENLQAYARLGTFLGKRRPPALRQAALQEGSGADVGRWSRSSTLPYPARTNCPDFDAQFAQPGSVRAACRCRSIRTDAFETPNGQAIPFVAAGEFVVNGRAMRPNGVLLNPIDPYASQTQSTQSARHPVADRAALSRQERHARTECRLRGHAGADAHLADRLQQGFPVFHRRFQPLRYGAGHFHPDIAAAVGLGDCQHHRRPAASIAIRSLAVRTAWWARICRRNMPGNSARNCGWPRISGPAQFQRGRAITCIIRRSKIIIVFFNLLTAIEQLTNGQGPGDFTTCHDSNGFDAAIHDPAEPPYRASTGRSVRQALSVRFRLRRRRFDRRQAFRHLYRSQSDRPARRPGTQLFPQRESLRPEFLCRVSARSIIRSRPI